MKKENQKKKILHIIDHLGLGGAQSIVSDLTQKNENHYALALRNAPNQISFSKENKHKIKILNSNKYSFKPLFEVRKEIKKNNIDVLHVHLSKSIFIIYLYKLLFQDKIKVIVNEHGAIFSKKRWFYRFILRRINRYTTCFIAVSKKIKEALIEIAKLDPKKIEVVYNFIDFEKLEIINQKEKIKFRQSFNLSKDDFLIGFVGRLSSVKNVDSLIRAYSYIKDNENNIINSDNSKTKILIIGDGELREELKRNALNEKDIIFLGFRKDVKKLYQILDVIVLPSSSEASPMAFYESQVYGIAFVGSDVYAINEFIKDRFNGLLFEFNNEKELAKKIIEIKDNKLLRENISENAKNNLVQFDINIYNKKMEEIYNR